MITDRIDAITSLPPDRLQEVLAPPRSVKVEITASCNYRCRFCTKSLNASVGDMDRALFSRLIREMRDAGVEELGVFYIGESFLCSWLPEAIAEAKAVGFPYVFLTTNGSAANPSRVRRCMQAGLDSLKFSLNFCTANQLSEITGTPPRNFLLSVQHMKIARRIRDDGEFPCGIYASSIAFDGEQGALMRALVEEIAPYVDEHYWLPLYGMAGASAAAGWKPRPGNPGRLDKPREPIPCWSVFTEGHITKDGLLSACCFGNGSTTDMVMADLRETSFIDGWNSDRYKALRAAHIAKDLRGTPCMECASA